jgi:acyl carrier protein
MTPADIKGIVMTALTGVAPEIDAARLQPDIGFRDQFDLDSMDFLNFIIALHDRLGVDIPEADYPRLSTLDGAVAYLSANASARTPGAP